MQITSTVETIHYGYKLCIDTIRLGFTLRMEPCQGLSTKLSNEYTEFGLDSVVIME
jgi:hypothetical protein